MKHMAPPRTARRSLAHVFAVPLLLFGASIAGLLVGLTGDGTRDVVACVLLFLPILAIVVAWQRRGQSTSSSQRS